MRDIKPDQQTRPESAQALMEAADTALAEARDSYLMALDGEGPVDLDVVGTCLDEVVRAAQAAHRVARYEAMDLAMAAECGDRIAAALARDPDPDEQHDDIDEWTRDYTEGDQ